MSLSNTNTSHLVVAIFALAIGGLVGRVADGQDNQELTNYGTRAWVVYRFNLGIDSKDEDLADRDHEADAADLAARLRHAENRMSVSYSYRKRPDGDSGPLLQDTSVPKVDPPTGRGPAVRGGRLPRVNPAAYKRMDAYNDTYNDPFKGRKPVVVRRPPLADPGAANPTFSNFGGQQTAQTPQNAQPELNFSGSKWTAGPGEFMWLNPNHRFDIGEDKGIVSNDGGTWTVSGNELILKHDSGHVQRWTIDGDTLRLGLGKREKIR